MVSKASNRPTKKQREMLTFIENFIAGNGYGPSYREIKSGLGYNSVATVALHIDNLVAKGLLRKSEHRARSLELVDAPTDTKVQSSQVEPAQEKWLVNLVDYHFKQAELSSKPTQQEIDNLYVLVGALKVLGLEGASNSFIPRLSELKKKK